MSRQDRSDEYSPSVCDRSSELLTYLSAEWGDPGDERLAVMPDRSSKSVAQCIEPVMYVFDQIG